MDFEERAYLAYRLHSYIEEIRKIRNTLSTLLSELMHNNTSNATKVVANAIYDLSKTADGLEKLTQELTEETEP